MKELTVIFTKINNIKKSSTTINLNNMFSNIKSYKK